MTTCPTCQRPVTVAGGRYKAHRHPNPMIQIDQCPMSGQERK